MQVVLVMFRDEGERRSFSIAREVTIVGRREDCDFRIPLGEISRKHCRIIKDGDVLRVEDMGSSNGTFHNGERIQTAELQPGDTVQVGSVAFVVQIDGVPAEDELQPRTAGDRKTALPGAADLDDSDRAGGTISSNEPATIAPPRNKNKSKAKSTDDNAEFDPMSVLDAGASGAHGLDDSNISEELLQDIASKHTDEPAEDE